MKTKPIIIILLILVGGYYYSINYGPQTINRDRADTAEETKLSENENTNIQEKETIQNTTNTKSGDFVMYENIDITSLDGTIILDFSASWCPSCRSFKKDVEESLRDIPKDMTLILVDYDDHKDLRKKYSVLGQHTFVQIDNMGNKMTMWRGGNTLESLFPHIQ